ncbi:hypothetical protein NL517_30520, partial [Klebsiella pneumoniae]|nr:hypothetical protein [Klebsiella pneumoniae]
AHYLPKRKNDLTRLARSFDQSCQYAYKDPCSRVGRDPLRKLSAFERVFSSVAYNVSNGFSFEALLSGAIFGYLYLMEEENQP